MAESKRIYPIHPNVKDPITGFALRPAGRLVEVTLYWLRRVDLGEATFDAKDKRRLKDDPAAKPAADAKE